MYFRLDFGCSLSIAGKKTVNEVQAGCDGSVSFDNLRWFQLNRTQCLNSALSHFMTSIIVIVEIASRNIECNTGSARI